MPTEGFRATRLHDPTPDPVVTPPRALGRRAGSHGLPDEVVDRRASATHDGGGMPTLPTIPARGSPQFHPDIAPINRGGS